MQKVLLLLASALILLSGCASFSEKHHFRIVDPDTGKTVNYMRLTISGTASWSKANYCSGYFDEKVLEKFFSGFPSRGQKEGNVLNTKSQGTTIQAKVKDEPPIQQDEPPIQQDIEQQGTYQKPPKRFVLEPLENNGTLTLLLSTNASGVLNAIDAFAQNESLAYAVTNLINRDQILEAYDTEARLETAVALSTPLKADLDGKFEQLKALEKPTKEETVKICKEILSALSRASDGPDKITSFEQAEFWVNTLDK